MRRNCKPSDVPIAKTIVFLGDLVFLNLCIYLSVILVIHPDYYFASDTIYLVAFSNITWLFLVMVATPYNVRKGWSVVKIFKSQSAFIFIHLVVVIALVILFNKHYVVWEIALVYLAFFPIFFVSRVFIFYLRKDAKIETTNFILIGDNDLARQIRQYFLANQAEGRRFHGYFDVATVQESFETIMEHCNTNNVKEIYCVELLEKKDLEKLIEFGVDSLIRVRMVHTLAPDSQLIQIDKFDNLPGVDVATVSLDELRNRIVKRIFDLFASSHIYRTSFFRG